jgi:hypothetical protein
MENAPLVICPTVPERAPQVEYLRRHLPGLVTVVDRGLGPWTSWMTCWLRDPGRARIIVQDDVILTRDAYRKMTDVLDTFPGAVVQFFDRYAEAGPEPGIYVQDADRWGGSCCYYLPPGMSRSIAAFAVRQRADPSYRGGDDDAVREYLVREERRFVVVEPSVVEHGAYPSLVGLRRNPRRARFFVDPETDGLPDVAARFLSPAVFPAGYGDRILGNK